MPGTLRSERAGVPPDRRELLKGAALLGGLTVAVLGLTQAVNDAPVRTTARALAFAVLSAPVLLTALGSWRALARSCAERSWFRWLFGGALVAAVVPERILRGEASDLVGIAAYVAAALLLTLDRPREPRPTWRDVPLVALLWLPLETGLVHGDFVLLRLLGLNVLLLLFVIERPVFHLGRLVPARRAEWAWGVGAWLGFLAISIPLAVATGFAAPGVSGRSPGEWVLLIVATFWVIALPEEALFRGVIQTLLDDALRRRIAALAIASLLFGLSHLNNATKIPAPDWRYVALATIAGVAYGLAFLRTGNLAAPTLTHFLVDVTWRGFFAG